MRASRRLVTILTIAGGVMTALAVAAQPPPQVDDATLLNPPAEVWVGHGRDYAETHHSPLAKIDQSNVARLTELMTRPSEQRRISVRVTKAAIRVPEACPSAAPASIRPALPAAAAAAASRAAAISGRQRTTARGRAST